MNTKAIVNTKNAISVFEATQASSIDVAFNDISIAISSQAVEYNDTNLHTPLNSLFDQHDMEINTVVDQENALMKEAELTTENFNSEYKALFATLNTLVDQLNHLSDHHNTENETNEIKDLVRSFDDQLKSHIQGASRMVDMQLDKLKQAN